MFDIKSSTINRVLLYTYLVGALFILSGCWDRVEINDLAIVTAAAIDKKEKEIEVSLQVIIPKNMSSGGQGGGGIGGGSPITLVATEKGTNMSDALSKLQAELPRKIFWGQCKVFIFSEQIAKEGIQDHLDFLLRDPEPRERAYMFVSEGEAKKLLEPLQSDLERYSAESMKELVELNTGIKVTLQKLDEMLASESKAAALPYIKIMGNGQNEIKKYPKIMGSAIFIRDKMSGKLSQKDTRGILWLRDEIKGYTVTTEPENKGTLSLNPVTAQVKLIPQYKNEEWVMHVKIQTEGTVVQNTSSLNLSKPSNLKIAEKAFENDIRNRVELVTEKIQTDLKADIVGFAKEFHKKYPKQWRKAENSWNEIFPEVKVIVDVNAHIRREGYITKPTKLQLEKRKEQ